MQFKVPQDVQQADRIVWFLTLPQLIICVAGFAIAFAIYSVLNGQGLPMLIWLPPVAIVVLLTSAFAFLKIANLPFYKYLALLIERLVTPSKRVWVKGADRVISDEKIISLSDQKESKKKKKEDEDLADKKERIQNIGELTEEIDKFHQQKKESTNKETKKIDEASDEGLIKTAFLNEEPQQKKEEKEKTAEEKIRELSKKPNREGPNAKNQGFSNNQKLNPNVQKASNNQGPKAEGFHEQITKTNEQESFDKQGNEGENPKKKRRRRRRRKKKNTELETAENNIQKGNNEGPRAKGNNEQIPKNNEQTPKTEEKKATENQSETPRIQEQSTSNTTPVKGDPPVPEWLQEKKAEKKPNEAPNDIPRPQEQEKNNNEQKRANNEGPWAKGNNEQIPKNNEQTPKTEEKKATENQSDTPRIQEQPTSNTTPVKGDPPVPEWLQEKKAEKKPNETPNDIPRPQEQEKAKGDNDQVPRNMNHTPEAEEKTVPAAPSGEFTPDQLVGEGQVITFNSPTGSNKQGQIPNDQKNKDTTTNN